MKETTLLILVTMAALPMLAGAQEIYQWVDDRGTVHFTDDFTQVPEKYQDQVKKKGLPEPTAAPSPSIKTPEERVPPEPLIEKKDIAGRGEQWWRDQAMQWKQKLIQAQRDYAAAQANLKAKEKEIEESKLKPKSFQRRLQEEAKVLEQKLSQERQRVDEARHMLETVLPRQAEEYRADPRWVRVD